MDTVRPGLKGAPAELGVVVLSDGEDRPPRGVGRRDRAHPVVGSGREVHDHPVDVGQDAVETGRRADGNRDRITGTDQVGQAGRPDEVVGEDSDAGGQSRVSARW
jgi:hypothetical protein